MKTAICWMRRDLRLHDNTALSKATQNAEVVIPVFILDPSILGSDSNGIPITAYMAKVLESLAKDIAEAGGTLVFRYGQPVDEMKRLIKDTGAEALYFNKDYEPSALTRDDHVTQMAKELGLKVECCFDLQTFEPAEIHNKQKKPFTVFTPYYQAWLSKLSATSFKLANKPQFNQPAVKIESHFLDVPKLMQGYALSLTVISETQAREHLDTYLNGMGQTYAQVRDFPEVNGTSRLSPALRFGTLSTRSVIKAAQDKIKTNPLATKELETFIKELAWRDFYRQIMFYFPHVVTSAFRPEYDKIPWSTNKDHFAAWCTGNTGFPLVDAGMRQLNQTGWMHNRLRMITASFLTKDLHISWQWGEKYFMQKLIDADLAANNGGWQWSSSTGTDAQPYFRIFNPTLQAKRFDPEGKFIDRYVPEANLLSYQPIVNHAEQKVKAIELFKNLR